MSHSPDTRAAHAIHRGRRHVQRGNPLEHGIGAALAIAAAAAGSDDAHCVHGHVVSIQPVMLTPTRWIITIQETP